MPNLQALTSQRLRDNITHGDKDMVETKRKRVANCWEILEVGYISKLHVNDNII